MRRSGFHQPPARGRLSGGVFARLCLLFAALALAVSGANPVSAHPGGDRAGAFMVICADGAAKTVRIGGDGAPVTPWEDALCAGLCLCCPVAAAPGLPPVAPRAAFLDSARAKAPDPASSPVLGFERGRIAVPRGPPSKDQA
jgi:hypothetical protein